jgi:hypothetical protein
VVPSVVLPSKFTKLEELHSVPSVGIVSLNEGKGKGKIHPRTSHEGPDGE